MANHGIAHAAIEILREKEQRRNRRHALVLFGRIRFSDGREDVCSTVDASAGGLEIRSDSPGLIGSRVTCHFQELGWVDGEVRRHTATGFGMQFTGTPERLTRISTRIEWLARNQDDPGAENRASARIVPSKTTVTLHLGNQPVQGRIIDISRSGAALAAENRPQPGSEVTVGMRRARVVRILDEGFAVEFNLPLPISQFDANVVL